MSSIYGRLIFSYRRLGSTMRIVHSTLRDATTPYTARHQLKNEAQTKTTAPYSYNSCSYSFADSELALFLGKVCWCGISRDWTYRHCMFSNGINRNSHFDFKSY